MWDALFVSNFYNIFYITGFKGLNSEEREAFALILKDKIFLFTDGRHNIEKLKNQNAKLKICEITPEAGLMNQLKDFIKKEKIKTLGFEEENLMFSEYLNLKKEIKDVKLRPVKNYFLKKREIKTNEEIVKIKQTCKIADRCLSEIVKTIKVGQSEREIAFKIEFWLKNKGYEMSFYPIVASQENAAIPHYDTLENGLKKIKKDSVLLIDYGVKVKGYCSDTTRVIFIGKPKMEVINAYEKLLKAQEETINKVTRFKKLKDIDELCRKLITNYQLPNYPHSTGHGVGLEVHENPRVSHKSKDKIKVNQIFTIEPGVYFSGKFGLRIEDMILIKENRDVEVLTKFSKKPYFLRSQ